MSDSKEDESGGFYFTAKFYLIEEYRNSAAGPVVNACLIFISEV